MSQHVEESPRGQRSGQAAELKQSVKEQMNIKRVNQKNQREHKGK